MLDHRKAVENSLSHLIADELLYPEQCMARLRIDYLKPSMVWAEDLKHTNGRFLLGKGFRLEENHLHMFKIWEVNATEIEGENDDFKPPTEEQISLEILVAAGELVRKQFSHADLRHPFSQELLRLSTFRRAQKTVLQGAMGNTKTSHEDEGVPISRSESVLALSGDRVNPYALVDEDISLASLPNFDHTQIGGILLKKWRLPLILEHAVEYHHSPLLSQYTLEASLVYLADILGNALDLVTSDESLVPNLLPEVWDEVKLPPEIFAKIIQFIDH